MATVWVVEQGEYSDYRVVGVFTSKAHAHVVADAINAPHEDTGAYVATVAEWPLDPAVEELRQGFVPYFVLMLKDGTVERCTQQSVDGYDVAGSVRIWRRAHAPAYVGKGIADALQAQVWAKDEQHAIKIANEHRARLIASGEWDTAST
jgi:hypothetical protein